MKKIKIILCILIVAVIASVAACFFGGCDFVRYVEKTENNIISDEIKELQEDYVEKLYSLTSSTKYRENEQKIYEYAVQDAENELRECRSEDELKQVYEKHITIIGKIKTDDEYSKEEEENAINAYRSVILGQAEESYDKQKYSEAQIGYFDSVFATFADELSATTVREEMNELLQNFYFDVHKEDEILSLINYADTSAFEDSQKEILVNTLDHCIDEIRRCGSEEDIQEIKSVYIFEVYKRNTVRKLNEYVDLQLYREEQAEEIKTILNEQLKLAEKAETAIEEDNIFREYQIAVYNIPTDEMQYNEELEELKEELNRSLINTYKLSFYREAEGFTVQELLKSFENSLELIKKKEDILSQFILVKNRLDSVKTAAILDEEDRLNLIEELYTDLQNRIEKNIDGADKEEFLLKAENTYLDMQDRKSLDGVRAVYRVLTKEISAKFGAALDILKEELNEYNSSVFYREKEQNEVNLLKEDYLVKFTEELDLEGAKALLQEAKDAISQVKTNDDLWNDHVNEFRADLKLLYGDAILEEPRSLVEANDVYELANIIDYYAFYQLSGTEFVCDTFRVKLNFDHNDAWTELVNVYWYCELIRTAAGITNYFENNSDYLVFRLIPYNFASVSNQSSKLNRFDSAVEFDSDKSQMTSRPNDFDDFSYYKYNRTISVWNSQQLWYALEHEYVPICIPESPAELVMCRAKEILREIIMEGMSDEEKIFQIYTWFGNTGQYDWNYNKYLDSTDMLRLPDENVSRLRSFHVEGALFDSMGVCYSYAKANLLLLRLEGIETYYVFSRATINDIGYGAPGWAGHGYNYIRLNNNWFIGDALRSFYQSPNYGDGVSYLFLLLPAVNIYDNFTDRVSRVNSNLWEKIISEGQENRDIYKRLKVDQSYVFTSKNIFKYDKLENIKCNSFSLICDSASVDEIVLTLEKNFTVNKINYVDTYIELLCFKN